MEGTRQPGTAELYDNCLHGAKADWPNRCSMQVVRGARTVPSRRRDDPVATNQWDQWGARMGDQGATPPVGQGGATGDARAEAAAALRRLRDAAGQVLASIADAQPVAPHHLLAMRVVAEGAQTPSDVAAATDRHVSSVSRVIDQLVEIGLLDREPHPDDRRQVLLTLTRDGAATVARFEALDHGLSAFMVSDFDAGDARRLADYLDRLASNATALASELEEDPGRLDAYR